MTTITHEQARYLRLAIQNADNDEQAAQAMRDIGITIAPPDPPEAMVKLAEAACLYGEGTLARRMWVAGYIAALQHAAKVVREAKKASLWSVEHACVPEILRKLGAL